MWQKLGLAFLAGGIAVGAVVYFGLKEREVKAPAQPAPLAQASAPAPEPQPVAEAREVPPPEPRAEEKPAAAPRYKAEPPRAATARKAAARAQRQPEPVRQDAQKVEVAQAAPTAEQPRIQPPAPQDVRVFPPPAPAPSPEPPAQFAKPAAVEQPAPPKREPRTVTVPAGTLIPVRLRDALSTERQSAHDAFFATLDAPLIVEGLVIAERGALVRGRVVDAQGAGRVKGRAALVLQLDELSTADGQKVEIRTDAFRHEAESGVKGDVARTGVAAGIGAAIGAIAGGGKGAAIGAAIGGAAGAGGAMATRGKPAELPSETRLSFRLSEPVTLTERLP